MTHSLHTTPRSRSAPPDKPDRITRHQESSIEHHCDLNNLIGHVESGALVFIAYTVISVLLGLGLAASGWQKIRKNERIVAGLTGVGVPLSWFVPLALLDIAGTVGLLVGI